MNSVYIIGFPNGKCYVGITSQKVEQRFKVHVWAAQKEPQYVIHHALMKYGPDNVKLMVVATGVSRAEAFDLEIWWISRLDTFKGDGYNETAGGDGITMTPETRAKIGKAMKGKKHAKGYRHTAEALAKISAAGRGPKFTAETKVKMSKSAQASWADGTRTGHELTDETKAKIGKANRGKVHTTEQNAKHNEAMKGRKATDETKAKMSEAHKERWQLRREAAVR